MKTDQLPPSEGTRRGLEFSWHALNSCAGILLALTTSVLLLLLSGILSTAFSFRPAEMIGISMIPVVAISSAAMITIVGTRAARKTALPSQNPQGCRLPVAFHINNVLVAWLLGFVVSSIPAIGIPILGLPTNAVTPLASIGLLIALFSIGVVGSKRAESYCRKAHYLGYR